MADRPIDAGPGNDQGPPRAKEGGGRGRRRRRKPGGNKAEGQQDKDASGRRGTGGEVQAKAVQRGGRPESANGPRPAQPPGGRQAKNQGPRGERGSRHKAQTARADKPVVKPEKPEPPFKHVLRRYGLAIFDTHQAAKAERAALVEQAKAVDQLNIVIRAEGPMDDPELTSIGNVKVFAGTAWALIHDRRVADGWYNEPR